jgi:hypothetical protein
MFVRQRQKEMDAVIYLIVIQLLPYPSTPEQNDTGTVFLFGGADFAYSR